jgi:glycogen synthase
LALKNDRELVEMEKILKITIASVERKKRETNKRQYQRKEKRNKSNNEKYFLFQNKEYYKRDLQYYNVEILM